MTKKIGGQLGHLAHYFFPKFYDQNFKIVILFIMVERPSNYAFGSDLNPPPTVLRKIYKICPLFTYSICYWDACIHFRVWRGKTNFLVGIFAWGNCPSGGKFLGSELVRGNYAQRKFAIILIQNSFCVLLSLFRLNFTRGVFKSTVRGKFSSEFNCLEDISMVRRFLCDNEVRFPGII